MTKEQAYDIFKLKETATKEQINKKYENFMRRAKFDKSVDDVLITKAYDTLLGYNWGEIDTESQYYQKGLNKKKIENFFYHYTRHLIYGAFALIVFSALLISIFSRQPQPDIGILVMGSTIVTDQIALEEQFEADYNFDFVQVINVPMSHSADGELTSSYMYKLATTLQGGEVEIIFSGIDELKFLTEEDACEDLSKHFEQLGITKDDDRIVWLRGFDGVLIAAGLELKDYDKLDKYCQGDKLRYISIADYTRNTENAYIMFTAIINE